MKFIETVSNRSRDLKVMRRQKKLHNIIEDDEEQMKSIYSLVESWEIALVNEIFGCKETTPEGEKYLYELYPPHLDFFRRLNNTQAQLESSKERDYHRNFQMGFNTWRRYQQAVRVSGEYRKLVRYSVAKRGPVASHQSHHPQVHQPHLRLYRQDRGKGYPIRRVPELLYQVAAIL